MSENALANLNALPDVQKADETQLSTVLTSSFLPRYQLVSSKSDRGSSHPTLIMQYTIEFGNDQFTALGTNPQVLPVCWRYKALDMSGDNVIANHDPRSEEFKDIQSRASLKDSRCMFGMEFLVWVPSLKIWATWFFGSKSTRPLARIMKDYLKRVVSCGCELVEKGQYKWHVPTIKVVDVAIDLPEQDDYLATSEKFNNPPVSQIERVKDTGPSQER